MRPWSVFLSVKLADAFFLFVPWKLNCLDVNSVSNVFIVNLLGDRSNTCLHGCEIMFSVRVSGSMVLCKSCLKKTCFLLRNGRGSTKEKSGNFQR